MLTTDPIFSFSGGQDRSVIPVRANKGTFYTMQNIRHSREMFGKLELTPRFYQERQLSAGTYYAAGSQTEPSSSQLRLVKSGFWATDYTYHSATSTQIQAFIQSYVGAVAVDLINAQCLLVINSISSLAITLGSTVDIKIVSTTEFQWRKNGGAYSGNVSITTTGVSIDSGNATVYFLITTGFTVNDVWTWTRTDSSRATPSLVRARPTQYLEVNGEVYFIDNTDRVCVKKAAITDSAAYIITVGYQPAYGSFLTVFSDKLWILSFSRTALAWSTLPRRRTIACSDKRDYNNFCPTDTNESDTKLLPATSISYVNNDEPMGLFTQNGYLYVFMGSEIFWTPDLGLPLVFDFQRLTGWHGRFTDSEVYTVVVSEKGAYLLTDSGVEFFNGAESVDIGAPIRNYFGPSIGAYFGSYDSINKELIICTGSTLLTYQERRRVWNTRIVSVHTYNSGYVQNGPTCLNVSENTGDLYLGSIDRKVLVEDQRYDGGVGTATAVFDAASGVSYTIPTLITQMLEKDSLAFVLELSTLYVAAWHGTTTSSSLYAGNNRIRAKLGWYTSDVGFINGSVITHASAYWDNTKLDGEISFPRTSARSIAFELTIVDSSDLLPTKNIYLTAIEPTQCSNRTRK